MRTLTFPVAGRAPFATQIISGKLFASQLPSAARAATVVFAVAWRAT